MAKIMIITLVAMIVAISTVSSGPGCSKYGGTCGVSAASIKCCKGYLCNAKDLKCEMYVGPRKDSQGSQSSAQSSPYLPRPGSSNSNNGGSISGGSSNGGSPNLSRPGSAASSHSSGSSNYQSATSLNKDKSKRQG